MTNVDKGYMLAKLFPEELPGILSDLKIRAEYLLNHQKDIQKEWGNGLITLEFWSDLARSILTITEKYQTKLVERPRLFADQLFDGYHALFTTDAIVKYAQSGNGSTSFQLAVELFFKYHPKNS